MLPLEERRAIMAWTKFAQRRNDETIKNTIDKRRFRAFDLYKKYMYLSTQSLILNFFYPNPLS